MGFLSLVKSPASPALQKTTEARAGEALKQGLISPELYQKLTDGHIDRGDLSDTKAALNQALIAQDAIAQQTREANGWTAKTDDPAFDANRPYSNAEVDAGNKADVVRDLLGAVRNQQQDQGALKAIEHALARWTNLGE